MPFGEFPDTDTLLGPEIKSISEVMGTAPEFGAANAKAQLGAGQKLPVSGAVFISVTDKDEPAALDIDAVCRAISSMKCCALSVRPMQDYCVDGGAL